MNDSKNLDNREEIKITDFVKSLSIKSGIPADLDYREELTKRLIEKYQ